MESKNPLLIAVMAVVALVVIGVTAWLIMDNSETQKSRKSVATPVTSYELPAPTSVAQETKAVAESVEQNTSATEQFADEEKSAVTPKTEVRYEQYRVQKGDSLYKLSKKFYGSWKYFGRIYALNNISNPDKIYEGQILTISYNSESPKWDASALLDAYVAVYKAYVKTGKIDHVHLMLNSAVKSLGDSYFKEYENYVQKLLSHNDIPSTRYEAYTQMNA